MKRLENNLLTNKYTEVFHEEEFTNNAPHRFEVIAKHENEEVLGEILTEVKFQEGPIKEAGINGVHNEDLIAMVICRLEHFQQSEFRCRENALAITALEEAMLRLRQRTMGREKRGVEGTHVK